MPFRINSAVKLIAMIMVVAVCAVGILVRVYQSGKSLQCTANAKVIASALHQYHEKWHAFPPVVTVAGPHGMHSWRAILLEHLDVELARQYRWDEAWDGPHNRRLKMPAVFACPNDPVALEKGFTSYFAVVSPNGSRESIGGVKGPSLRADRVMVVESNVVRAKWLAPIDIELPAGNSLFAARGNSIIVSGDIGGAALIMGDGGLRRSTDR
jgi:hypothetical protein